MRNFNILQLVFGCKLLGVLGLAAAWGSHKKNARGAARALRAGQLQDAHDLFKNNALGAVAVKLDDLAVASLLDPLDLKAVLGERILSELLYLLFLELNDFIFALEVPLHFINAHILSDVEKNELVRDNIHFLKRDRLKTGAREPLDDPAAAGLFVLHLLDVMLD